CRVSPPLQDYVLVFASSSAQAFATPEWGVFSPREVAHPPASINSRCFHDSIFWNSASFTAAFGCCMNLATQEGVRAPITAALLRSTAIRSAVLPRVHPNQEKPMIIVPIAPMTTPQAAGLNHGAWSCMEPPPLRILRHRVAKWPILSRLRQGLGHNAAGVGWRHFDSVPSWTALAHRELCRRNRRGITQPL